MIRHLLEKQEQQQNRSYFLQSILFLISKTVKDLKIKTILSSVEKIEKRHLIMH